YEDEQRWKRSPSLLFLEGVPQLRQAWPSDRQRLSDYAQQWRQSLSRSSWRQSSGSVWLVLAALLAGVVLLRVLPALVTRHAPGGRLRGSGLAMANFMVWMGMAWIVGKEILLLLLDRPGLSEPQLKLVAYTQL